MATYRFETITAEQAEAFMTPGTISVDRGTASQTTVIFNPDNRVSVTIEGRTVTFGSGFRTSANPADPQLIEYPDGSLLLVGHMDVDTFRPSPATARSGAIYTGGGNDSVQATGTWLVQGNQGDDYLHLTGGVQTVYGGQGSDFISVNGGGLNFAQGNKGFDTIMGSVARDTLLGGQDDDQISGFDGQDFLNGNLGADTLTGGGLLLGEGGADSITTYIQQPATVRGGDGDDRITIGGARAGTSNLIPRGQPTEAFGEAGDDVIRGGTGADTMMGGDGNDTISSGADTFSAHTGETPPGDVLDGGAGDDILSTRDGANVLRGGDGADRLSGGEGADTLHGGTGGDTMAGDSGGPKFGADLFILDDPHASLTATGGVDRITDWSVDDRIQFRTAGAAGYTEISAGDFSAAVTAAQGLIGAGAAEVVAVQVGGDVVLFADGSAADTIFTAVILVGRGLADISGANVL